MLHCKRKKARYILIIIVHLYFEAWEPKCALIRIYWGEPDKEMIHNLEITTFLIKHKKSVFINSYYKRNCIIPYKVSSQVTRTYKYAITRHLILIAFLSYETWTFLQKLFQKPHPPTQSKSNLQNLVNKTRLTRK